MKKHYYAAENVLASSSSFGFANSWRVLVFESKTARANFIDNSRALGTKAIKKNEVTKYATNYSLTLNRDIKPKPFTREFWGIVDMMFHQDKPSGCVGTVEVCDEDDYRYAERIY